MTIDTPRTRKRESYEGPGTGRAWLHKGARALAVDVMLGAAEPGEGAQIGDVWLTFTGDGEQVVVRLDIGAKRFLHELLEQALTIGDFSRGV